MSAVDGRTVQIPIARAYTPFLRPSRYKGAFGGRGSAKSHEFANLLIDRAMMQPGITGTGLRWVCVREFQKSLDQSVKLLLEDKIKKHDLSDYFHVQHNQIGTPGDGLIIFQGMQDHTASSIKSLEGYDGAWVEEAQTLSKRSLELLRPTIRKEGSELWFTWNPDSDKDPVDKLLRQDNVPDAIVIGTTFRDNPWFPDVLRKEMEWDRKIDYETYVHVWEGGYQKRSNSRVFKNWRVEEFDLSPYAAFHIGSDSGYSVDPATLVRCHVQQVNPATNEAWPRKRLYIDHECYRVGVEIEQLPSFFDGLVCGCQLPEINQPVPPCRNKAMHGWARGQRIVADSARPDLISYIRRHGYGGIEPSKKGANSVREGVIFLQGYDVIIHPRCTRTKQEFENYSFVIDKDGTITNELEDKKNHIIDPLRYALEQLRGAIIVRRSQWG
jgi:phage terminase large subunit